MERGTQAASRRIPAIDRSIKPYAYESDEGRGKPATFVISEQFNGPSINSVQASHLTPIPDKRVRISLSGRHSSPKTPHPTTSRRYPTGNAFSKRFSCQRGHWLSEYPQPDGVRHVPTRGKTTRTGTLRDRYMAYPDMIAFLALTNNAPMRK